MKLIRRAGLTILAAITIAFTGSAGVTATQGDDHKVVVCKYVGTPGEDERLQTGNNPIVVSVNALEGKGFDGTFPFEFSDAQGRSVAIRYAADSHDGDISECPGYEPSPSPSSTPSQAPSSTPAPTEEPTATPTSESSATPTPTPSSSTTPQPTESASPSSPTASPTASPSGTTVTATMPPTDTEGNQPDPSGNAQVPGWVFWLVVIGTTALILGERQRRYNR